MLTYCSSNEIAQSSGKKTISPQDVMEAMKDCEFEDFLDRLHQELRSMSTLACLINLSSRTKSF